MRTYWRYHRVDYGDTLPGLARKYHTSTSSIEEANNLTDGDLKAGTKLIIPIAPARQGAQTRGLFQAPNTLQGSQGRYRGVRGG